MMGGARIAAAALVALAVVGGSAVRAHVGSSNVFYEGAAGPYSVRIVIRPPGVVPGLADIAVRVFEEQVDDVSVRLFRWDVGEAGAPPPEPAAPVPGDPELFSAELWLMTRGSHSVHVAVSGAAGSGVAVVPFNSVATTTLDMERWYGMSLLAFGAFLFVGAITIMGASVRESTVPPGESIDVRRQRNGRIVMAISGVAMAVLTFGGWRWWDAVDATYRAQIYRPLPTSASVAREPSGQVVTLRIEDERFSSGGWTPLVPDHGKLMHMFLVREDLGAFAHVHPVREGIDTFRVVAPPLPEGAYRVYADIVHESGFSQTLVDGIELETAGATPGAMPGDPDDSWLAGRAGSDPVVFGDGVTMDWQRPEGELRADEELTLRFVVRDADGAAVELEPYMGMLSHAAVARDDGSVFVHLHPRGSISMGALALERQRRGPAQDEASGMPASEPGVVSFPFAFPSPGNYRIWVQVKRDGQVMTGDFEAIVEN